MNYVIDDEGFPSINPVRKKQRLRRPRPLPKHLKDDQVNALFKEIEDERNRAIFMLMLRCGLRVEEIAPLTIDGIEYRNRQVFVFDGKGSKGRVVYMSEDARSALRVYLNKRELSKGKRVFWVQKGPLTGEVGPEKETVA